MEFAQHNEAQEYTLTDIDDITSVLVAVDAFKRLDRRQRRISRSDPMRALLQETVIERLAHSARAGDITGTPEPITLESDEVSFCLEALRWGLNHSRRDSYDPRHRRFSSSLKLLSADVA
jgi:hypothetical protein